MSPGVRRAFHQALDLVLDALAEEEREAPKKRRKPLARPLPPLPPDTTPEEMAATAERWARAGWRKSA